MRAFHLDADSPPCWRWEDPAARRYYEARVTRGLFGEWYVLRVWGSIGTSHGGEGADLLSEVADAPTVLEAIAKRRAQRGYELVPRP